MVENGKEVPFDVKRVYYLYDVPGGESRGGHAHKALHQLIVAASGSFSVTLDDGKDKKSFVLNQKFAARPQFENDDEVVAIFTEYADKKEQIRKLNRQLAELR